MNKYEEHLRWLDGEIQHMFAVSDAIKEIKNNPTKYPEFDFWKPGYDAEGWAENALVTYTKLMGGAYERLPIVHKLVIVRHYRKRAQKWRKDGKGHLLETEEFAKEVIGLVKELHPEFFE